jgi:FkbH-like protein
MPTAQRQALMDRLTAEIDLVLGQLSSLPLVLFNRFSAASFEPFNAMDRSLGELCDRANAYLGRAVSKNTILIDCEQVFRAISMPVAMDWRLFHSGKSPYTFSFYKAYAEQVRPYFLAACGKAKKAMIFDCDNTLWGGILGEDGQLGIEMSAQTQCGAIFAEVQRIALTLQRKGVILGLCSKNNAYEVDQVIATHPDMLIRDADLAVKKVNWQDKVSNLQAIAGEMNIGLDSIVLVDDSSFEIDLVNSLLPQVKTVTVPERLSDYPDKLRRETTLFFQLSRTDEDRKKTEQYYQEALRREEKKRFADVEDYLRSLGLSITVYSNDNALLARMAQLSQKTNQFNLTTQRYTEAELDLVIRAPGNHALAFRVCDRFGDYGITGLALVRGADTQTARLEAFLISCRVLGRNVEYAFFEFLVAELKMLGVGTLFATYRRTEKNGLVANLLESLGFSVSGEDSEGRHHTLQLDDFSPKDLNYISVVRSSTP